MKKRIVVIGAAGQMTSVAVNTLIKHFPEHEFLLTDYNISALQATHDSLAGIAGVDLQSLDLYQSDALAQAVQGADLVINGAGPFHKTAAVVSRACIAAGADYLDIGDDVESTQEAIAMDAMARDAGVALYVGCGASPGITNVIAADLINQLDDIETIEVGWTVGDEGAHRIGRAVVEHVVHIGAGECITWRNGKPFVSQSFVDSRVIPMGGALGDYRLYECAHPETVMLPFSFPHIRNAWCWGGLHPQSVNGLIIGIARAYRSGKMTIDEACMFLQSIIAEESGSLKGWRCGLAGMIGQVRRNENSLGNLLRFLWMAARKKHPPTLMGMMARAVGRQQGKWVELYRCIPGRENHPLGSKMAIATGMPQAAFSSIVLRQSERRTGTIFPESIASFEAVAEEFVRFGFRHEDIVYPLQQRYAP
jgi:hypothetical protein